MDMESLSERPGVTRAGTSVSGKVWHILGQTYVPKTLSGTSMSWHATLPPGTFVPPHIHPTQDEYVYLLEGQLELVLGDEKPKASAGDMIRLPMGIPHGIFNNGAHTVKCLFWVSPTRKLFDLFNAITNVADPAEVVRLAAQHEVNFLPPP